MTDKKADTTRRIFITMKDAEAERASFPAPDNISVVEASFLRGWPGYLLQESAGRSGDVMTLCVDGLFRRG